MSSQLILIVEENASTRAFLAEQLEADGYEILLADSRRHALRAPRQPPAGTGVGGHQRAHARSARRRPRRRGAGRRDRPGHADDRADLAGGRARPGAGVRARRG